MPGLAAPAIRIDPYLDGYDIDGYLDHLSRAHPDLFAMLDRDRCRAVADDLARGLANGWEFEDEADGGRGNAYNVAQKSAANRHVGMVTLLGCMTPALTIPGPEFKLLDVLGGDGTLARFCTSLEQPAPTIYTADISRFMIEACLAQGLPCLRQPASLSGFRDGVLDGVMIAYGSHHLDAGDRQAAAREAWRTLGPGGQFVLHDFEIGGASAEWFDAVVHPFSRTGHPHAHFSSREMSGLMRDAGFEGVEVFEIHDPFTLAGASPEDARRHAIMHLYEMYDLIKIADTPGEIVPRLGERIEQVFGPIEVWREGDGWIAQISRSAMVALGSKPLEEEVRA